MRSEYRQDPPQHLRKGVLPLPDAVSPELLEKELLFKVLPLQGDRSKGLPQRLGILQVLGYRP